MDLTTIVGFAALGAGIGLAAFVGALPAVFLDWHGLGIVVGGTAIAMLINSPFEHLLQAVSSVGRLFGGGNRGYRDLRRTVKAVVTLAERAQANRLAALQEVDAAEVDGYLRHAAQLALEYNDPEKVYRVLDNEIDQNFDRQNEVVNVFRTAGILAPMFGLLGTLIGIVQVLRLIASPEEVGPAMAVAVTTAFYGIFMANALCIPIAGKLRVRYREELLAKTIVKDGIVAILKGTVPIVIERDLSSYL
jgi:chemotaxis protein MotA